MIKRFIAPVIALSLALSACSRAPARPAIEPTRTLPPPAAVTAPTAVAAVTSAPPVATSSAAAVAASRLSLNNAGALDKLYSHGDLLPANLYTISGGRLGMYNTRAFEVFDPATLKSLRQTPVGINPAGSASWYALSPDARTGAIMWLDGRIDVYDLEAGALRTTLKVDPPATEFASDIAINQDGSELLAISQGILKRIRIADGKQIGDEQRMVSDTMFVIFARDGAQMAVVRAGGAIDVLDTLSGKSITFKNHVEGLSRILFSPDGGRLFTSNATTVTVWDAQTGDELWSLGELPEAVSVALPPNGDVAVLYSDTGMVLYDTAAGKPVREISLTSGGPVNSAYFSEDGRTFYAAGSGQLEHFDVASGKRLASVRRFAGTLMRFTPDDRLLTWSDRVQNGELAVLAAADGATVASMQHKAPVRWSVGSAKGTYAATNTRDQALSVWRTSATARHCLAWLQRRARACCVSRRTRAPLPILRTMPSWCVICRPSRCANASRCRLTRSSA